MKTYLQTSIRFSVCVLLLCSLTAAAQNTRWYLRADAGAAFTQDTELKEFFGPVAPNSKVRFDPGVRFVYGGGYRVTDWFSAEAQSGIIANSVRSVTGSLSNDETTLSNVPLLVNVRFECPDPMFVTPYFGGGLGMTVAILDTDNLDVGGTPVSGSEGDVVFAYQAFAGLRFRLNDQMGLGVAYHYFGTGQPEWGARNVSGQIGFGRIETHTATVAFDFRF